jgi:predicted permease
MYRQILTDRFVTKQTMTTAADIAKNSLEVTSAARGYAPERLTITRPIFIVWGIVGLVLVIACVNVAGLMIARATTREREIATRLAIGAGRWRITRQLLAEGMLLAALGGGAGMLVAWAGVQSLDRVVNSGLDPLTLNIAPDVRVLGVTISVCVLTGLLCGLAPALRVSRLSLVPSLKSMQSTSLRPRRGRLGLGQTLVVAQVGLSLALVVAAGLFARTLVNLEHQSVGFDRSRVLLAWAAPTQAGLTKARLADLYDAAIDRVGRLPGVRAVAVSSRGILGPVGSGSPIRVPGYVARPTDDYFVSWNIVTPAFFSTAGIQLLAGRDFGPLDVASGQRVAIVSEALAKHYFGGESPIGKRFGMRNGTDFPLEVIGVAHDAVDMSVRSGGAEMIYLPHRQDAEHMGEMCVIVRTDGPPAALAEAVRRALHDVDSALPVVSVSAMDEQVSRTLVEERVIALLSGLFGALALALAAVGLYAIVAQSVATRSPELAIRLALGGAPGDVLGLILRESLSVVGIGIVVGLAGARFAARSIANQLFGVSTFDPWTIGVAVILMLFAATLAAWAPARRAALTDPMNALRGV